MKTKQKKMTFAKASFMRRIRELTDALRHIHETYDHLSFETDLLEATLRESGFDEELDAWALPDGGEVPSIFALMIGQEPPKGLQTKVVTKADILKGCPEPNCDASMCLLPTHYMVGDDE
tara:strand:+ start:1220 stop:1579 length:360 start_codon:yes stop_codon:yes gene_type:complete